MIAEERGFRSAPALPPTWWPQSEDVESEDVMNGSFVAGLSTGLLAGGVIGIFTVALVTAGSNRRFLRAHVEDHSLSAASPLAGARVESSMRIDLLLDLNQVDRYVKRSVADDIEQEMKELVRRYGTQSGR